MAKKEVRKPVNPVEEQIWKRLKTDHFKKQDDSRQMEQHWRASAMRKSGPDAFALAERAWAAGFWDGEGHSSVSPKGLHCSLDQHDRITVERFQAAVGGIGTISGPRHRVTKTGKRQLVYRWAISNQKGVNEVWNTIGEFLTTPKRIQFGRVIAQPTATKLEQGKPLPEGAIVKEITPRETARKKRPG